MNIKILHNATSGGGDFNLCAFEVSSLPFGISVSLGNTIWNIIDLRHLNEQCVVKTTFSENVNCALAAAFSIGHCLQTLKKIYSFSIMS